MMKTSTTLLLSALVILIIGIGIYNSALKAEYLTGDYKKPYRNYKAVNIKGFTKVEINAANMMDVEFKQGDFTVYKGKDNEDSVEFTQVDDRMIVNINLKEKPPIDSGYKETEGGREVTVFPQYRYRNNRIIIVCPNLKMLQTSDVFFLKGKAVGDIDKGHEPYHEKREIKLSMFKLDSLEVIQHSAGTINMEANIVKVFKANVGKYAAFDIYGGNIINKADLQINKHGELTVGNISIPNLTYHFADSTKVSLSGASLKSFIKQ